MAWLCDISYFVRSSSSILSCDFILHLVDPRLSSSLCWLFAVDYVPCMMISCVSFLWVGCLLLTNLWLVWSLWLWTMWSGFNLRHSHNNNIAHSSAVAELNSMSQIVAQLQTSLVASEARVMSSGCNSKATPEFADLLNFSCFGWEINTYKLWWFQFGLEEAFYLHCKLQALTIVTTEVL